MHGARGPIPRRSLEANDVLTWWRATENGRLGGSVAERGTRNAKVPSSILGRGFDQVESQSRVTFVPTAQSFIGPAHPTPPLGSEALY